MNDTGQKKYFTLALLQWNTDLNKREMPWKGEKDPYRIWLSEIILQQTRVDQGLAYYNRFIAAFPSVKDLALASETTVFKLWEGLGYYTRCKNLIATAKFIHDNLNGRFPHTYEDILRLKGIGPYTAAAIASFAFNLPHAVVDGNVFRVLSRYFGLSLPIDSTAGKKLFSELANELLEKKNPGIYNQALMDFGAVICKPQIPLCIDCIMNRYCKAYLQGTVQQLPVKEKLMVRKSRWICYLVLELNDEVYVRKRGAGDVWENLYEFVFTENTSAGDNSNEAGANNALSILGNNAYQVIHISALYKQVLTHQVIHGQFIHVKIAARIQLEGYQTVSKKALLQLPFPKFISTYLKDKNVSLNPFHIKENQHSTDLIPTT